MLTFPIKITNLLANSSCRSCVVSFLGGLGRGSTSSRGLFTSGEAGTKSSRLLSSKSTTMVASFSSIPFMAEALKLRVTTSHILTRILPLGTVSNSRPSGSFHTKSVKDNVPTALQLNSLRLQNHASSFVAP